MEEATLNGNLSEYLIQKKIEIMMDINNKKIDEEMKRINDMVCKLNAEINDIKRQLNGARVMQKNEVPAAVFSRIKEKEPNSEKSEQTPKPRYGDYTPEDVSINKMFYFGNKK